MIEDSIQKSTPIRNREEGLHPMKMIIVPVPTNRFPNFLWSIKMSDLPQKDDRDHDAKVQIAKDNMNHVT